MGELLSKFELLDPTGKQALLDYLDFLIARRRKKQEKKFDYETVKPIREHQSMEDMIQAQNYKGFDKEGFDRSIKEMDV